MARLKDIGQLDRGRSRHRPRYAEHLYGGPYPFIQTGDIKAANGRITAFTQTYSEAGLAQSRLWPANTLCITIAANIAETAILTFPACFPDSVIGFIADESRCDVHFVEFMFRQLKQRIQLEASGSVQDNINLATFDRLYFPLPPLPEQREIAHILAAFDDKIDLNRRMNAALEATARALFQSWFVDFDPVRAKAEGRAPEGMDAATAALFPDSFEDSALGPIPSGWRVAPLSEHIEAVRGLSYKGSGLTDAAGGLPMHNLNSVYEGGGYKYEGMKYYSGEYQERHLAKAGDLIVTNTEQGHDLLLIGYPALIPTRYPIGLFSHHLYRVRPLAYSPITLPYVYFLLKTNYFHDIVSGYANGTTVNMLHVNGLQRPLIVIPPAAVLARFDDLVLPMLQKQESSHSENERLAKTRDAMLPHLISGELRVTRE
ncbi:MAG: restriction endonuclease subunit S [Anaerolineae bacterium]|nr:restriction endonuclease subunit S [Anaerolineae bacterium]